MLREVQTAVDCAQIWVNKPSHGIAVGFEPGSHVSQLVRFGMFTTESLVLDPHRIYQELVESPEPQNSTLV